MRTILSHIITGVVTGQPVDDSKVAEGLKNICEDITYCCDDCPVFAKYGGMPVQPADGVVRRDDIRMGIAELYCRCRADGELMLKELRG